MSTNISKEKREQLIAKISEIKAFIEKSADDKNKSNLLSYMGDLQKELINKHYGLIFEEHRERIDEILSENLPVLTEEKDLFIDNGGQQNFLIEGDNLASLQLLEKTHRGKIELIYIDPPYNTGNKDFIYDDNFVDCNDTFRHSKWCSFMQKRLELARKLLSEKGVIFISIDDNEQAALKLLCDDVFGSDNFQSIFHVQVRYADKSLNEEKPFKPLMEYIYVYSRNKDVFIPNRKTIDYGTEKFCWKITELTNGTPVTNENLGFIVFKKDEWKIEKIEGCLSGLKETWVTGSIYTTMSYGKVFQTVVEPRVELDGYGCLYKVLGRGDDGLGYRYYTGPAKTTATKGKMFSGMPISKVEEFQKGNIPQRELPIETVYDYAADFGNIRTEGGVAFNSGKKPVKMITNLLQLVKSPSSTILDFFAGSGTTGHAVLKLNAEDGGSRKFILCTNNENSICRDVTYERIKRVIQKENYAASLKYFRVEYIPITDRVYYDYADQLLEHTKELVELENAVNFTGNAQLAIILSEDELDSFCADKEKISRCKKIYLGHECATTAEQDELFVKQQISVIRIPNYYYKED